MAATTTTFRLDFPEFASTGAYPDDLVSTYLTVAQALVSNADRWGTLLNIGQELVAAHYIVLGARDRAAAQTGAVPGTPTGLQVAKGVADLSVSYDFSNTTMADAGFWNLTTYGQRFWSLARVMGAGGIQLPSC